MKVLSVINNDKDAVTKEYVDSKAGVTAVDPTSGPVETDLFIPTKTSELTNDSGFITEAALTTKQDTLVSGTNIKTINNQSLLGSGNITISGGGSATNVKIDNVSITSSGVANINTTGYDADTNFLATVNDINNIGSAKVDKQLTLNNAITTIDNTGASLSIESTNSNNGTQSRVYVRSNGEIDIWGDGGEIYIDGDAVYITSVADPVSNGDAVNKKYVDDIVGDIESLLGGI